MAKERKRRAVLLLGAGAAIDFGAPSTRKLTEKIENFLNGYDGYLANEVRDAYKFINEKLKAYLKSHDDVNFEHIYHVTHELLKRPNTVGAGTVNEYRPLMQPFLKPEREFSEQVLKMLAEKITQAIFLTMKEVSRAGNDVSELAHFIQKLRAEHVTRIFTTNYDDFILQAAPDLYTGFPIPVAQETTHFDLDNFYKNEQRDGVFHLHGSIHMGFPHLSMGGRNPHGANRIGEVMWFSDPSEASQFLDPGSPGDARTMDGSRVLRTVVITGLDKLSSIQTIPMAHYYQAFGQDLMRADVIFVIGSGLSDLHLNTWLGQARMRNPRPPLIFVDYWEKGYLQFSEEMNDRKEIDMFHCLDIRASIHTNGVKFKNNWTIAGDKTSAVWDGGFKKFLESNDELEEVLSKLAYVAE